MSSPDWSAIREERVSSEAGHPQASAESVDAQGDENSAKHPDRHRHQPSETPRAESAHARDRRWVEGTRRHDEAVFDDMFVAFHESMLRYAVLKLGTRDEADETVQDVFIDVWKLGERWTVRGSVSAYLFGALRRKVVDAVRRQRRRGRWFERAQRGDDVSEVLPRPSVTEARVQAQELDERIRRALKSLPGRCQETLVLSRDYDCSYDEIALRMGVTRETVRTQLKRAYAKMRAELSDLR
jgi:RNA polymerase sigma factor (sigma-70 family)